MLLPSPRELFDLARLELDRRDAASSAVARSRHAATAMFYAGEGWRLVVPVRDNGRTAH